MGGHYTYARVNRSSIGCGRFFIGTAIITIGSDILRRDFVPAMIARELFIGLRVFNRPGWMPFVIVCVCLGISAFYEFIEWWTALLSGSASTEFLATQGDVWDTQEDMFMALIGAICALFFIRPWQDRQLAAMSPKTT